MRKNPRVNYLPNWEYFLLCSKLRLSELETLGVTLGILWGWGSTDSNLENPGGALTLLTDWWSPLTLLTDWWSSLTLLTDWFPWFQLMKRLEKARKKADALDQEEGPAALSEKEKWQQIKR